MDHTPSLLVALVRCPAHRQTRNRHRVASRRLSPLLALAIPITWRAAENHSRTSGFDRPPGQGESRLGRSQDPRRTAGLGFTIAERTVARYLRRIVRGGDPEQKWLAFIQNHREVIAAMDFFTVPTVTFRVLNCFFVIEHGRRKVLHCNVTPHPTGEWIVQQLREAFAEPCRYRYMILDRDQKFDAEVLLFLRAAGLEAKRTSVRAPWQNGLAERWIGSCRREILDHVIALNEEHLRRILREYVNYHHEDRLHDALEKDTPNRRAVEQRPGPSATVTSMPRLGGLHHRYTWRQAA